MYSDCRNVSGSLGQGARAAFLAAYGPTDEREQLLDAPVATLFALLQAAESPRLPTWADALLAEVRHGALARQLDAACAGL